MGVRPVVFLVVYRAQIQVGLQLAVGTFYLTGKVVIVPCGLLVKGRNVGPEEIDAAMPVHVLRHGNAPLYVGHVPQILRVVCDVVDDIVFGDGRILLPCPANTLYDFLVVLRAIDFVFLTRDSA